MSNLDEMAVGFVNLAEAENEDAVAICTMGGKIVVRYASAKIAEGLIRRVLREWEMPKDNTLQ